MKPGMVRELSIEISPKSMISAKMVSLISADCMLDLD